MRVALAAATIAVSACASSPPPVRPETTQAAFLRWRDGKAAFAGPAVVGRDGRGGVSVQICQSDGGSATFQLDGDGMVRLRSWHGALGDAPAHAKCWVQVLTLLQSAEAIPDGRREIHSPGMRAAVEKRAGRLVSASILDTDTGALLTIQFPVQQKGNSPPR